MIYIYFDGQRWRFAFDTGRMNWSRNSTFGMEREEIVYIRYVVFVGQEQMSTYGVSS